MPVVVGVWSVPLQQGASVVIGDWRKRVQCAVYGHPAYPTGRDAFSLYEVCCRRCHRRYVANPQYPNVLLPIDHDFERIIADAAEYQRRAQ